MCWKVSENISNEEAERAFENAIGKMCRKASENISNEQVERAFENVTEKCAGKYQKTSVMRKQKEHLEM